MNTNQTTKHTPLPWTLDSFQRPSGNSMFRNYRVLSEDDYAHAMQCVNAAPELREALRLLIQLAENSQRYHGDLGAENLTNLDNARSTLAKHSKP
jgi:hypothetical protein